MEGWISIHRKIAESDDWLSEPFSRGQAWIDLLILTNHQDGYIRVAGERIEVLRGQCGWSQVKLSERFGWSRDKLRKWLNELEKDGKITKKHNNRNTIITICNYNKYQSYLTADKAADKATEKHQIEQQKNIRPVTNNNDNNDNNDNKRCDDSAREEKNNFQKVFDVGLELFPMIITSNPSPIHTWLSSGCDVEWDIIQTMKSIHAKGTTVKAWNYFTNAIADAKKTRTTPMPEGEANIIDSNQQTGNNNYGQSNRKPTYNEIAEKVARQHGLID